MGGSGEKGAALPLQLPFPLHLSQQGVVGRSQVGQGGGEALGHTIQTAAQGADLIPAGLPADPAKVQLCHFPRNAAEADDGAGDIAGIDHCAQGREGQQHQQHPGGHPGQGRHCQVFRAYSGGDIELAGLPAGKGDLGNLGVAGYGEGVFPAILLDDGCGRVPVPQGLDLRCGEHGVGGDSHYRALVLIDRLDGELGVGVLNDVPIGVHQHDGGFGGADELVQDGAAVLQGGDRQAFHQQVSLGPQIVAGRRCVGDGGGPGNQGEGDGPRPKQDEEGNEEDADSEALMELPSQHDSPPPSLSRCSRCPACDGDS